MLLNMGMSLAFIDRVSAAKMVPNSPKCPQVDVDVRHLLRIPEDFEIEEEVEDEFECLNLDVTIPADDVSSGQKLPVLVWIYGGFQFLGVSFCEAHSVNRWFPSSYVLLCCIWYLW
jgi:hypothetical protein